MDGWQRRVEEEARGLARLLPLVLAMDFKVGTAEFSRHAATLLARLRHMYFLETGALGFLRVAASGLPAPDAERRRLRADHGGFDAAVERAAEALKLAARRHDAPLGMEALAVLTDMVEDRTCIRDSILGMLSSYGGPLLDAQGRRDDAAFILQRIETLAPRFQEAEARLRQHARDRGLALEAEESWGGAAGEVPDADAADSEAADRSAPVGDAPRGETAAGVAGPSGGGRETGAG
ncbi:hypothetical protein P2H44_11220 [Albimonas sp. CAU 1670]|uniref:hypothetical protein n=1 Tax=Albimonas sp. CAU 1670 TaxID=3032599 RepID=UPI0023DA98C7|nr:hypothetical protein [Albimonas sp. CAU 1670]MDF2233123.1 hypothetical protein [Albimonas sp. CAU 1670]